MSAFKDLLERDLEGVFINTEEFADTHTINGVSVKAVIDSSVANDFQGAQLRGVFTQTLVVFIRQGALDPLPVVGARVNLDGLTYYCGDVRVEQGLDVLTLERREQ